MAETVTTLAVRIAPDDSCVEVYLTPALRALDATALIDRVAGACTAAGISSEQLTQRLTTLQHLPPDNGWFAVLRPAAPYPPQRGRITLLAPIPNQRGETLGGPYCAVRARQRLAQVHPPTPGAAGYDLYGRPIPPPPPQPARLPLGPNVSLDHAGTFILARCDGIASMSGLQLSVHPLEVCEGLQARTQISSEDGLVVVGDIPRSSTIRAVNDIYVNGHIREADVASTEGSVFVAKTITGSSAIRARVRAHERLACEAAYSAELSAGSDLHVRTMAEQCTLITRGCVHLYQPLDQALVDTRLSTGTLQVPLPDEVPASNEQRRHLRASCQLSGHLGFIGRTPGQMQVTTVLDVSISGVRCSYSGVPPAVGSPFYLSFRLPGRDAPIHTAARLTRVAGRGVIGLCFVQLRDDDREEIAALCRRVLGRTPGVPPKLKNRRND